MLSAITVDDTQVVADFVDSGDCKTLPTLVPGSSCAFTYVFTPSVASVRTLNVTVASNASNPSPVTLTLTGTGVPQIAALDVNLFDFGGQGLLTTSVLKTATLSNIGTGTLNILSIAPAATDNNTADFDHPINATSCVGPTESLPGSALVAGVNTCTLSYAFQPQAVGARGQAIAVVTDAGTVLLAMRGIGSLGNPLLTPSALSFGNQLLGVTSSTSTATLTNTGTGALTVQALAATDTEFTSSGCPVNTTLDAGQSCTVSTTFTPSSSGAHSSALSITTDAGVAVLGLSGTGIQEIPVLSPTSLTFDLQRDGVTSAAQSATLTNAGSGSLSIQSIAGLDGQFGGNTGTCQIGTTALGSGQSCTLAYSFTPTGNGPVSSSAVVTTNVGNVTLSLSGIGTSASPALSPASLAFGDVAYGASKTLSATLSNSGGGTLQVTADPSSSTEFIYVGGSGACVNGTVLTAGQGCNLTYQLQPSGSGAKALTAQVVTNLGAVSLPLSGNGVVPTASLSPASIGITWGVGNPPNMFLTRVTNTGTLGSFTLGAITSVGDPEFVAAPPPSTTCSNGTVLAPAQYCTLAYFFNPVHAGSVALTVTIPTNVAGTLTLNVTGTGVMPTASLTGGQAHNFGSIGAGYSSPLYVATLANVGLGTFAVGSVTDAGDTVEFVRGSTWTCTTGLPLSAGHSCTISYYYRPVNTGADTMTVTVPTNIAGTFTLALSGTGVSTTNFSPSTVAFGNQLTNTTSSSHSATLNNSGTATLTISSTSWPSSDFASAGGTCPSTGTLAAGQHCTLVSTFHPTTPGAKNATVTLQTNTGALSLPLTGNGIEEIPVFTPTALNFGTRGVGLTTPAQSAILSNAGGGSLIIQSFTTPDPQFGASASTCQVGTALAGGQSCTFAYTFTPASATTVNSSVVVTTNVGNVTLSLSGIGTSSPLAAVSPASLDFGNVGYGVWAWARLTATLTNIGGGALHVTSTPSYNSEFIYEGACQNGTVLYAGQSCNLQYRFQPNGAGPRALTATFTTTGGNVSLPLTGTGVLPTVTVTPASKNFGTLGYGSNSPVQVFTLANTGTLGDVTVESVFLSGDVSDFWPDWGFTCSSGTVLPPGGSCTINYYFEPIEAGSLQMVAALNTDVLGPFNIVLTGAGVMPTASLSPLGWDFGAVSQGTNSAVQTFTYTNTGALGTMRVWGPYISGAGADRFQLAGPTTCGIGDYQMIYLGAGQSCTFSYYYAPATAGTDTATVTMQSDPAGTMTFTLSGTGF